jgi:putative peptide zinc metalloprotease protein
MNPQAHQAPPSVEENPLPRLRRELVATPQVYDGQPYWVIKDPLSLRYYRFNREEYFLIDQLRRGVTLREIRAAHRQEFKTDCLTNHELGLFIAALTEKNLLVLSHAERDRILFRTSEKRRRAKLFSQISNFMFLKIPLYDPDALFNRIMPHLRFIWSWGFFAAYLVLLALAGVLIVRRWSDFVSMAHHDFFTIRNLPLLFFAFYFIKALHELGHGFTCKNYGGEVHEVGFLFLVFTPFFYCNVTDSWTFPHKARRLLVGAAGIMTELFFAGLATIVWYFTDQPGFLHALMFNLMMACSISTVLFNANPLLKYDGYYVVMDLIEVPNLRQRASNYINSFFLRHLLGGDSGEMPEEHRFRVVFPIYALASWLYRWFVLVGILYFIYALLEQVKLVMLGRFVVAAGIVTMGVIPLTRGALRITRRRAQLGISHTRMITVLALIVAAAAGALFWPLEQTVTLNFILEPQRMQWLRNETAGLFQWTPGLSPTDSTSLVPPKEGAWIESPPQAAPTLARLDNPELAYQEQTFAAQIVQTQTILQRARRLNLSSTEVGQYEDRLATFQKEHRRLQEQIANLEVKPALSGAALSTDQEMRRLEGAFLERGAPLLLLADTRVLAAKVWVPEGTWDRIFRRGAAPPRTAAELSQKTELMLYAFPAATFRGRVTAVNHRREERMGEFGEKMALSNKVGGEVVTEYDPQAKQEKPIEPVYEVTVTLDGDSLPANVRASARPYMSGRARIDCGRYTLYQWGRDSLLRFISPEVRL